MTTRTDEEFETFLSQLQETNATLDFFSNFDKISRNVAEISIRLHTLNYLLGQQDLERAVRELWDCDKRVFDVMDILIATRRKENRRFWDAEGNLREIKSLFQTPEGVVTFLEGTGLADVFRRGEIKDLHDYVFGVEAGLDSNARKNRSGSISEQYIAGRLANAGITFREQVSSSEFPVVETVLGEDRKVFDFVVETEGRIFLMEVNFYSAGGSKLNATARSYKEISAKINQVEGFEFVWITDGQGWHEAKNKLQEAYRNIPSLYNYTTFSEFIRKVQQH